MKALTAESHPDMERRIQIGGPQASVNGVLRPRRTLVGMLAAALSVVAAMATPARAADVLILGPTVPSGMNSVEYRIITGSTSITIPGIGLTGLGLTANIVPAAGIPPNWTNPPQPYSAYKAIVLGDPSCNGSPGPGGPIAAAEANAAVWAAAVTGNVVIIGTDATYHQSQGGAQLWKSAISFAAAGPGTGAVISLSCYYDYGMPATSPTAVTVLNGFGSFMTQKSNSLTMCLSNSISVVASSPALSSLPIGPSSVLSNWGCSTHEGFTAWPSSFIPLAIATDAALLSTLASGSIFTAADGTKGFPYILARGKTLTPVPGGILKVCKVAGLGVTVGTPFTFTAGTSTFTVPAGPAPGGTCMIGPTLPVGSAVTVVETIPPGHVVSNISVAPPGQLVGTPNLAGGSVNVTIGSGVTEVTFTDKRTGFIEICKRGHVSGNFTFAVNPGGLGPFVVPAGACSPAIEVAAGTVTITETLIPGTPLSSCATIPVNTNQIACNTPPQTSTVNVVPGNVSTMTIALITNAHLIPTGGAAAEHTHALGGTSLTLACAPNPAPLRGAVTCTAKVTAIEPRAGAPTGLINFMEGSTNLATAQLSADGSAAFTTSTLAAGLHAILASYGGDSNFGQNASQLVNVTVEQAR